MYYCYNSIILFWVKDVRKEIGEQYVLQLPCATAQCMYTCGLGVEVSIFSQNFSLAFCTTNSKSLANLRDLRDQEMTYFYSLFGGIIGAYIVHSSS